MTELAEPNKPTIAVPGVQRRWIADRGHWRRPVLLCMVAMLLLGRVTPGTAEDFTLPKPQIIGSSWVYATEGLYQNVRDDLIAAIEGEGLVISYTAHMASMLRRTADATGAVEQVYDEAQSLLFCKADLTYELTVRNPHNITLCPYSISIYTLTQKPDTVYMAIRSPELEQADYAAIHQLLEHIIAATLSW